jgi:ubiquinone/menaquinone biosynthesis C-methylase UbiE
MLVERSATQPPRRRNPAAATAMYHRAMDDNPRRFRSAAAFYTRYRPRYPQALIARVAAHCGLDESRRPGGRLMDLGCGPGFLAIAFAPYVAEAVGIDPEPEMLAEARAEAAAAGVAVTLVHGSSRELGAHLGRFRIVTMGRSFHWMDRDATLRALDALVDPGGSIVLVHAGDGGSAWSELYHAVAREWVSPESFAENQSRRSADWERHDVVLARSAFSRIERIKEPITRSSTIDELVGRAYSMSMTTPAALGERRAGFEAALRAALPAIAPAGTLTETVAADALIAQRP